MIAVSSDPPPDADARIRELLYFLDNVPADPDHARRDLRAGAILIAAQWSGWCVNAGTSGRLHIWEDGPSGHFAPAKGALSGRVRPVTAA